VTIDEAIQRAQAELEVQIRRCVEGMGMRSRSSMRSPIPSSSAQIMPLIFTKVLAMGGKK
jgi:hypothetical protein